MPAGTRVPWRPLRVAASNDGSVVVPEPPGMPQPIEPTPAKASTSGGSMVGALVGGALGFVLLRSALGAIAGGAAGYVFGPKPKEAPDTACFEGLTEAQRQFAEFLLTAPLYASIPQTDSVATGQVTPSVLRMAAIEAAEGGHPKLASCLRERADSLEDAEGG